MKLKRIIPALFIILAAGCSTVVNENYKNDTAVFPDASVKIDYKASADSQIYLAGAGIFDITATPEGQVMGGYAETVQKTEGVSNRLMARAFYFDDTKGGRLVYVSIDEWALSGAIKEAVAKQFSNGIVKDENGNDVELKDANGNPLLNAYNIMITSTHTHSGLSGFDDHTMYNMPPGGFNQVLFDAHVNGISQAIIRAFKNAEPAYLEFSKEELLGNYDITRNRSIQAHLNNKKDMDLGITPEQFEKLSPVEQEKVRRNPKATDKFMYLLKITSVKSGKGLGTVNWFSNHPTVMSCTNRMLSGDCKGVAANMFEKTMGGDFQNPNDFVAAFAQSALGDVDTLRLKYFEDKFKYPAEYEYENIMWTSTALAAKAMELYLKPQMGVKGDIRFASHYVNFSNVEIAPEYQYMPEKYPTRTAPAATGYSCGIGSEVHQTSLPGIWEGMTVDQGVSVGWVEAARAFIKPLKDIDTTYDFARLLYVSPELRKLQYPKPVLMVPSNPKPEWVNPVLQLQVFKVGNIAIVGIPFETTTVSGKRIKAAVMNKMNALGMPVDEVIYCGNTNAYASYMTTPEEYEKQHYEGGFSLFGINQLQASIQETVRLCEKMKNKTNGRVVGDPSWIQAKAKDSPAFLIRKLGRDASTYPVSGIAFGKQISKTDKTYSIGSKVSVKFIGARMNSNMKLNESIFTVQRYEDSLKKWTDIATDTDYETTLHIEKMLALQSVLNCTWRTQFYTKPGNYRFVIKGYYLGFSGNKEEYCGTSIVFGITESSNSNTFCQQPVKNDNVFEVSFGTEKSVNCVAIQAALDLSGRIAEGYVELSDGTKYPFANLSPLGDPVAIRFPERKITGVKIVVTASAGENFTPVIDFIQAN